MTKYIGYGVTLSSSTEALALASASTAAYTAIGQIRDLSGPAVEGSEVEATTLDSTDSFMEYLAGLLDPGNVTFQIAWDSTLASHVIITNGQQNRNLHNYKIELANGTTDNIIFFRGRYMSFSPSFPVNDLQTADCGIRVTGPIRWPSS